jgi:hypothetical protein
MQLSKKIVLVALGLLIVGCTSTPQSTPPTAAALPPPAACMSSCPTLPAPPGDEQDAMPERAVLVWLYDVIDAAGACRRQHDTCRVSHPGVPRAR